MAELGAETRRRALSGTEVTIVAGGLGLIVAIVAIYPPQGPIYPYLAYTLAIPAIVLGSALGLRPVREAIVTGYDGLGRARAIVTSFAVGFVVLLALVWYQGLPGPAQIVIARSVFPAFIVQAVPAPTTPPPPQTSTAPVVLDTPTPPAPTSPPDQIPPAVAAQLRQRDQQIADLTARLAAAEAARVAAEQEAERQRAAADAAREQAKQAAATPSPSGPASATPDPTSPNPAPARAIPQLPPVVPTSNVLETLSAYLVLGQNLRALYVRERGVDDVERQANAWYAASLGYINQNLGVD